MIRINYKSLVYSEANKLFRPRNNFIDEGKKRFFEIADCMLTFEDFEIEGKAHIYKFKKDTHHAQDYGDFARLTVTYNIESMIFPGIDFSATLETDISKGSKTRWIFTNFHAPIGISRGIFFSKP